LAGVVNFKPDGSKEYTVSGRASAITAILALSAGISEILITFLNSPLISTAVPGGKIADPAGTSS
jgi:hypothetical protein